MNHECQSSHEEDIVVAILDKMEMLGWTFRFQYDAQTSSEKIIGGDSQTSKELFLFHKPAN